MSSRAFVKMNGIWRHVYVLNRFEQITLDGEVVSMVTVKLAKNSKETYDIEASRLETKRPRAYRRKQSTGVF